MSEVFDSQLTARIGAPIVAMPSSMWLAAAAPVFLVTLAVARLLVRRSRQIKARAPITAWATATTVNAKPTRELSLIDAAVELIRQPLPSSTQTWYTQTPTRNRRTRPSVTTPPPSPTKCQRQSNTGERQVALPVPPRIVISAPDNESPIARFMPFKSGWVIPKQDTSGSTLFVPGGPTSSVHFALRLPQWR